jgi:hypothetical protein
MVMDHHFSSWSTEEHWWEIEGNSQKQGTEPSWQGMITLVQCNVIVDIAYRIVYPTFIIYEL